MRYLPMVLVVIVGCTGETPKKYQGKTAAQWYEKAIDADPDVSLAGCKALGDLGKEGKPHLLNAMDELKSRPAMQAAAIDSLPPAKALSDEELARVAHYLDRKYNVDGKASPSQVRVMMVLKFAGPRAKKWLPQLKDYEKDPSGNVATEAIKAIAN